MLALDTSFIAALGTFAPLPWSKDLQIL